MLTGSSKGELLGSTDTRTEPGPAAPPIPIPAAASTAASDREARTVEQVQLIAGRGPGSEPTTRWRW